MNLQRIGLIVAAGRGRRMGRTKQLVPWRTADGEKPLVAAAYDTVSRVCDAMIVVLGHDAEAVAAALGDRPFVRVNSDPDAEMWSSIRAGLVAAHGMDARASVLLQPGDHPEVMPTSLSAILEAGVQNPQRAILPEYGGHGGHPVLIPADIVAKIILDDCPAGLAAYWNEHPEVVVRVPADDPFVILDVDTPDQLRPIE